MPTEVRAAIVVKDARGKERPMRFELGVFNGADLAADVVSASSALDQVKGALDAVTDLEVSETQLIVIPFTAAVAGAGDYHEKAMVNCYLTATGDKLAQVRIPGASIGVFQSATGVGMDVVDIADTDLVQYIQQLAQHTQISDGEQIDTTLTNGIKDGVRSTTVIKVK